MRSDRKNGFEGRQIMDEWQKKVYEKCKGLIGSESPETKSASISISLTTSETYVVMKALEDQQRYLNPLLEVNDADRH